MSIPKRRWFAFSLAFVLLWAGLIFATSCTVISTDQLFSAFGFVFGPENLQTFEVFWGFVWFVVVKGWHALEFAILTVGMTEFLRVLRATTMNRNAIIAGSLAVLFAASDEYHQTYVPTREGSVWDVLIDSLGVGAAVLFYWTRNRDLKMTRAMSSSLAPARDELAKAEPATPQRPRL